MHLLSYLTVISTLALLHSSATAATYYVDSQSGNDGWSGTLSDASATSSNGPWQSLKRVGSANLLPGDIVRLRCGRTWSEPLVLGTSGSAQSPITITHYPDACADGLPRIQGSIALPQHAWRAAGTSSRYIDRRLNLMPDPDFLLASSAWKTWSPKNDSKLQLSTACADAQGYCLQLQSGTGTSNTVNYGPTFPIASQGNYVLRFSYLASTGTRIRLVIRRNTAPFDDVGLSKNVYGTGAWETTSVDFTATRELENARLDIEMPPGGFTAKLDSIRIEQQIPAALMMVNDERVLAPAHHPNAGHNAARPNSIYLATAEDSNRVLTSSGSYGSSYITAGPDLPADRLQRVTIGTFVSIRVTPWMLEERRVSAVSGNRIYLDRPTTYQVKRGWGYFFSGSSWMIDEANEWANDEGANRIYLATTVDFPALLLRAVVTPSCIKATGLTAITFSGIEVRDCSTAVDLTNSKTITLRQVVMKRHEKYGLYAPGVVGLSVSDSIFSNIGMEAVNGIEQGVGFASSVDIRNNLFSEIGVERIGGVNYALPRPSRGALYVGTYTTIENNRIEYTSYHGIRLAASNVARNNMIESTCMALDDCGAIYGTRSSASSEISGNVITNSVGWTEGKPIGTTSQAEGIYIDDHATNIVVTGNTVSNCDHGILLHNSANNLISGNTLFGNRRHEIWLLEDSNSVDPLGDLSGNVIENNLIFTNTSSSSLRLETLINSTQRFAVFDGNRYSALFSPRVASESSPSLSRAYTFAEWQGMSSTSTGSASLAVANGGRDLNGSVLQSAGFASYQVLTSNLVASSILAVPVVWTPWSDVLPMATAQLLPCTQGTCLELRGGGAKSLVASPPLSVREGQSYRISFDVQAPDGVTGIAVVLRRGGGGNNGFETLSPFESVTTGTNFRRYAFTFRSPKTINKADPVTQDIGARVYFERIPAGKTLRISNLEIVEISPQETTIRSSLLANRLDYADSFDCPLADTQPETCSNYFEYASEQPVTWPVTLESGISTIVYTQDLSLVDRDNDGIADMNDQCPATTAGAPTNAAGCALY